MKKLLLVMLLALLAFFMFLGIAQAGQCIYLYGWEGKNYYYDSSSVNYSGDIVSFHLYDDNCSSTAWLWYIEIDCVKRMIFDAQSDEGWESISPGSNDDTLRIKLCR